MKNKTLDAFSGGMTWLYQTAVWCFFVGSTALLTVYCAVCTCNVTMDENETTFFTQDSPFRNILFAAIVLLLFVLYKRIPFARQWVSGVDADRELFLRWRKCLLCVILGMSLIWALAYQNPPHWDQASIQEAVTDFRYHDYYSLEPRHYMGRFPHQLGITWLYYLFSIVFGSENYVFFQVLNAFALTWFYWELVNIFELWGMRPSQQLLILFCGILFFPMVMYCTFLYGTLLGLAFAVAAIRQELLYFKEGKLYRAFLCAGAICLGMAFKSNYQIFWVAMMICALLEWLRVRSWKLLLLPVLLIAVFWIQSEVPLMIARQVSGMPVDQGCSTLSWVAMGMQDGGKGPGWYNGYILNSYNACGNITELHSQAAKEAIRESLRGFMENKWTIIRFYSQKITSQWCNPNFEAFNVNQDRLPGTVVHADWVWRLLTINGMEAANAFLDPFEFVVFAGALLYAFFSWRRKNFTETLIFPMILVGGFLFHILWEAKGQYTLTYFAVLIPYAIWGYSDAAKALEEGIHMESLRSAKRMHWAAAVYAVCVFTVILAVYSGSRLAFITWDTEEYQNYFEAMDATPKLKDGIYQMHLQDGKCLSADQDALRLTDDLSVGERMILHNFHGVVNLKSESSGLFLKTKAEFDNLVMLEAFYVKQPEEIDWIPVPVENGGFYLMWQDLALTADPNGLTLQELQGDASQIWFFEAQ